MTLRRAARSSRTARADAPAARARAEAEPTDLRARVLQAAVELIEERGLADLSMREVARLAGVSHQAPYHHFADREAILAAIAEEGFTLLAERLSSARAGAASATDMMARAGEAYVRFAFEHPAHFRVMFRADFVDMDRFPEARACGDRAFDALPEIVRATAAEGLPTTPSEMAHVVLHWSLCHGLACLVLDGPLAKKLPELAGAREALTHDVMTIMRGLVEARIAAERGKREGARRARETGARARRGR